jgi:hypothetical protein
MEKRGTSTKTTVRGDISSPMAEDAPAPMSIALNSYDRPTHPHIQWGISRFK